MVEFDGAWTADEVEAFLQETSVPLRLATHRPDGSLWTVTLWYRYLDGAFECATWARADVVAYLKNDSEVAFDVSTNHPPYRGVRGNGHAALSHDGDKLVLRDLVERYLGSTDSRLAAWLLDDAREEVQIHVHPRRVFSWDYTDRMGDVAEGS